MLRGRDLPHDVSFTGQEAAFTLAKRFRAKALTVEIHIPSKTDTDWADVLVGRVAA